MPIGNGAELLVVPWTIDKVTVLGNVFEPHYLLVEPTGRAGRVLQRSKGQAGCYPKERPCCHSRKSSGHTRIISVSYKSTFLHLASKSP